WERFERIVLVYSVREARELAYQSLIRSLGERDYLAEHAHKLTYLPTITRERVPGALHGRITTLLESGELERAAGLELSPEHSRIMLCGNPQMIEDTRLLLKARDLQLSLTRRPGQVAVENYWSEVVTNGAFQGAIRAVEFAIRFATLRVMWTPTLDLPRRGRGIIVPSAWRLRRRAAGFPAPLPHLPIATCRRALARACVFPFPVS